MPPRIVERHRAEQLAMRLVRYGLPTSVVHVLTGLPRERTQQLQREIHGRTSRPGMLREVPAICRSGLMGIEVSLLVEVYRTRTHLQGANEPGRLDPEDLLWAYDRYLELRKSCSLRPNAAPLSTEQAYVVLRDWRAGQLAAYRCRACNFDSYYHLSTDPYCYPCASDRGSQRLR